MLNNPKEFKFGLTGADNFDYTQGGVLQLEPPAPAPQAAPPPPPQQPPQHPAPAPSGPTAAPGMLGAQWPQQPQRGPGQQMQPQQQHGGFQQQNQPPAPPVQVQPVANAAPAPQGPRVDRSATNRNVVVSDQFNDIVCSFAHALLQAFKKHRGKLEKYLFENAMKLLNDIYVVAWHFDCQAHGQTWDRPYRTTTHGGSVMSEGSAELGGLKGDLFTYFQELQDMHDTFDATQLPVGQQLIEEFHAFRDRVALAAVAADASLVGLCSWYTISKEGFELLKKDFITVLKEFVEQPLDFCPFELDAFANASITLAAD